MIRPLFPYYGSKWRDACRYPPPVGHVIEPFAGSAGYSLWWRPERVTLVDVDPVVIGVWRFLQAASPRELLALPDVAPGQSVDDLALPQEARWLIGFWLNRGSAQPKKHATAYSQRTDRAQLVWGARARERIAADAPRIRDWSIIEASYEDVLRPRCTWFVDPPYQDKGRYYSRSDVAYPALGAWCRSLEGHVIVCEQTGADWLPFEALASVKSTSGTSDEAVWTNEPFRLEVNDIAGDQRG